MWLHFSLLMSSLTFSLLTVFLKLGLRSLVFFIINANSSISVLMVGQYLISFLQGIHNVNVKLCWRMGCGQRKLALDAIWGSLLPSSFALLRMFFGVMVYSNIITCTLTPLWVQHSLMITLTPALFFSCGFLVLCTTTLNLLLVETWICHMHITFSSCNSYILYIWLHL